MEKIYEEKGNIKIKKKINYMNYYKLEKLANWLTNKY